MYVECRGEGAPAVVIVAGAKASAADWTEAVPGKPDVFAAVAGFTRVCAYDRPGTPFGEAPSRSDPVPQPATAADAADDLHALVAAAGIATPVVLVAHSYGGVIARLYARTWPDEVAGMVLVDALSEGLRAAETPEEWAIQRVLLSGDMTETLKLYPEIEQLDPDRSFDRSSPRRRSGRCRSSCSAPTIPGGRWCPASSPTAPCRPTSRRTSATSPTAPRRRRRPGSPPACPARGTSRRPTAATRSTRTSRSSSSTRSATWSRRCGPAGAVP